MDNFNDDENPKHGDICLKQDRNENQTTYIEGKKIQLAKYENQTVRDDTIIQTASTENKGRYRYDSTVTQTASTENRGQNDSIRDDIIVQAENQNRLQGSESEKFNLNVPFSATVEPLIDGEPDHMTINVIGNSDESLIDNADDRLLHRFRSQSCLNFLISIIIILILIIIIVIIPASKLVIESFGYDVCQKTLASSTREQRPITASTSTSTDKTTGVTGTVNTQCFVYAELDVSKLDADSKYQELHWQVRNNNCITIKSNGSHFEITQDGTYDIYTRLEISSPTINYFQHTLEVISLSGDRRDLDVVKGGIECGVTFCHNDLRKKSALLQKGERIRVTLSNKDIVNTIKPSQSYLELQKIL